MMGLTQKCRPWAWRAAFLLLAGLVCGRGDASAAQEETFPLLQIGTITYTNATVTTKAKKYIFILHSTGMANILVADLPPEIKLSLGYVEIEKKDQAKMAAAKAWAREAFSRFSTPQVMAMEEKVQQTWRDRSPEELKQLFPLKRNTILMVLVSVLVLFLFFSYCCFLICKKAGTEPGALVWLPLLQIFPMFRAARMSPLWFLAMIIPVVNIIPSVVLCFKLAKARGKSPFVGFLFALPITSFFAFLYLAFSSGTGAERGSRRRPIQTMKFGTASP